MIESKIRERLRQISTEYYSKLQVIYSSAVQFSEYSQGGGNLSFTPHGLSHINAVEKNYDWLLSKEDLDNFNAAEIFCLLSATYFHDALMIPGKIGQETDSRDNHIKKACDFLQNKRESLGLTIHKVAAISQIIKGHGVNDINEVQERMVLRNDLIDLRKLASCLSMADICHADFSRAPEIVFDHLDLDEESTYHWKRHFQISGITRNSETLLISALYYSEDGQSAIEEYKLLMERQLEIIAPYFKTLLSPINHVELDANHLDSPLDRTFRFQANIPNILNILIEGVYHREDVFIREIVQNSLDSCLIQRAREIKRGDEFEAQILITCFYDESESLTALRIDDNGTGMDVYDVEETVLWIGNTVSNNEHVKKLLSETMGNALIAKFGIGLMSCFKVSSEITVRTCKENRPALEFTLKSISEDIKPIKSEDQSIGTTIIIKLDENSPEISPLESLKYYCRRVNQASISFLTLDSDEKLLNGPREDIFTIAISEADPIEPKSYSQEYLSKHSIEIKGDDFKGSIWIPNHGQNIQDILPNLVGSEGYIEILNEGIFVSRDSASDWLPKHLEFCCGWLQFSSDAINLPAGRDKVIKDVLYREKFGEIGNKAMRLIDLLVQQTSSDSLIDRKFAALLLTYIYSVKDEESQSLLLKRLDRYHVQQFGKNQTIPLESIVFSAPDTVFLEYSHGRWVQDLTTIDDKELYHKEDDLIRLQAAIKAQERHFVISALREDYTDKPLLEANLILDYFKFKHIKVEDLTKNTPIQRMYRSKGVPNSVRKELSAGIKFVEISNLPKKKSWKVNNQTWINIANPLIGEVFKILQQDDLPPDKVRLAKILCDQLSYNFEKVIGDLISWIREHRRNDEHDMPDIKEV